MGKRRLAVLLLAASVTAVLCVAAVALAQEVPTVPDGPASATADPYETGEQALHENDAPDTDVTPRAKESDLWHQWGGALFPESEADDGSELIPGSVTSFDADLFAVSFRNTKIGFAGGSACADPPARADGESDAAYGERISRCETPEGEEGQRIPALYQFTDDPGGGRVWEQVDLPGDSSPGFIGSIAWIGPGRALAVGGDGEYPRREPAYGEDVDGNPCEPPEEYEPKDFVEVGELNEEQPYNTKAGVRNDLIGAPKDAYGANCDQAGGARAWLYSGGRWRDLTPNLPEGMRGLSAVDFYPGNLERGFAGGLGQIWTWRDGQFTSKVDLHSPPTELSGAPRFRFRVREIEFARNETVQAFAVTAGCCSPDRARDFPQLMAFAGKDAPPRWWTRAYGWDPTLHNNPANTRQDVPDSFYGLQLTPSTGEQVPMFPISVLGTRGGPPSGSEQPSALSTPTCRGTHGGNIVNSDSLEPADPVPLYGEPAKPFDPAFQRLRTTISTMRLHSADGDVWASDRPSASPAAAGNKCNPFAPRDGISDWAVGELRSTKREGLGARGLVFGTAVPPDQGDTIDSAEESEILSGSYRPTSQEKVAAYLAARIYKLPTYTLNSLDVIGDTDSGWGVGDHGAIVELAQRSDPSASIEPEPPRLGARTEQPIADRAGLVAPTAGALTGTVPTLAEQPLIDLGEPAFQPAGSPDPTRVPGSIEDVTEIVMSRDGSEGWAIGATEQTGQAGATTLYHYEGGSWSRCEMVGLAGQLEPDPSCAAVAPVRRFVNQLGGLESVRLIAAARVPLENDADPSNDDEFEVVAIGTNYKPGFNEDQDPALIRYRDGRWVMEDQALRTEVKTGSFNINARDVAFTAPDDGWILSGRSNGPTLFHFDGIRWTDCSLTGGCDDPDGIVPFGQAGPTTEVPDSIGLAAAGDRVYLYGTRGQYPFIAYHDDSEGRWVSDASKGGFDPGRGVPSGLPVPDPELKNQQGRIGSLVVAERPDGTVEGWAVGRAGPLLSNNAFADPDLSETVRETFLLRLAPGGGWEPQEPGSPLADYLSGAQPKTREALQAIVPASDAASTAFIAQRQTGRIFSSEGDQGWRQLEGGRPPEHGQLGARVQALAPDGQGGLWVAVRNTCECFWVLPSISQVYFFHYSDRAPKPVFEEVPQPVSSRAARFTALAGAPDGTVWATTDSGSLARYDRAAGWETLRVPGWDPGRVVTRASRTNAIALNESGAGVAVGEGGRIAAIEPEGVRLDAAAGAVACSTANASPCGTGRDLTAAAVAPGGSALVGGERMTLLWRPSGGDFSAIPRPSSSADVTGISMPSPDRAYVTVMTGAIYRGEMSGPGAWSWEVENLNPDGDPLALDETGTAMPLRAIAVDADGRGYSVGERGLLLERTGDGQHPWRRLRTPFLDDLRTVTLTPGGRTEALIGGENGLVLTGSRGKFGVARPADYFNSYYPGPGGGDGQITGPVVGLAVLPGAEAGQTEAWAAIQGRGSGDDRLLHYASDPSEPLLDPNRGVEPLPDVPPVRSGELSFGAFGKSDCPEPEFFCPEMTGSTAFYETVARGVVDELAARRNEPGGPGFTVFTGDAVDAPDYPGGSTLEQVSDPSLGIASALVPGVAARGPLKLRRWAEFVADPLEDADLPLFGAIGGQDLSAAFLYNPASGDPILNTKQDVKAGDNLDWRRVMSERATPWGAGEPPASDRYSFTPVADSPGARRAEDVEVDPDGEGVVRSKGLPLGGASTHYAVDVTDNSSGEKVARIVILDNSLRSLQASDPVQQPLEANGELGWLDQMLCREGLGANGGSCTREENQRAIVVANTPTYSYGPGILTHTATDFGTFESVLFKQQADVVVSGRLGWNGLYWATAPGVHVPCPGGEHPSAPPEPGTRICDQGAPGDGEVQPPDPQAVVDELTDSGLGATGLIPFVVASSAGGKFGPDGRSQGTAADGFWHGYSVVRLSPDGDPRKTVVEQRPLLDWVQLSASTHVLRAGRKLALRGLGREPMGIATAGGGNLTTRFDEISTPAITHRYDLVEADPDQPWLPREAPDNGVRNQASTRLGEEDPCGPYLCLDSKVGTVDEQTGEVKAGKGNYPRTHAVAMVSVGEKSATWPLVFEPRASFRAPAPPPPAPVAVPAPPPPPAAAPPTTPQVNLPAAPVLPVLTAQALAPPPIPPAPPTFASEAPLDLNISPTALDVTPPTAVSQPPTPPVNPAPPSGARREARQRQAAAQKSGADSSEGTEETQDAGGDLAQSPPTNANAASRQDFTALAHRDQPSAWARDALLGGGLGIAALLLALGASTARPTPRRRQPEQPAPAWARSRRRS